MEADRREQYQHDSTCVVCGELIEGTGYLLRERYGRRDAPMYLVHGRCADKFTQCRPGRWDRRPTTIDLLRSRD